MDKKDVELSRKDAEIAGLKAEVERLTRDLAEAIHARDGWENECAKVERGYQEAQRKCADLQAAHDADCGMALELVELRRKCGEWAVYLGDISGNEIEYRMVREMREEAGK